ncbi:TetR family transcriptional regulator [Streptacidiphilus cavernicola]|uniref:TetR family transcriptional regulator n=1 Tax=Streptacidiphilus cavernicola TaxID=3342716 RepID=A0ABV6VSE4_9ACTN
MQDRAERTRAALLRATAELVNESRYRDATMAAIAQRAGASKGSLYFHFASKDALCAALRDEALRTQRRLLRRAASGPGSGGRRLLVFARALTARLTEDPVFRAGLRLDGESAAGDGESTARDGGIRLQWRDFALEQLSGRAAPDRRTQAGAALLTAVLAGLEELSRNSEDWLRPGVLEPLWDLLEPGLTPDRDS